MKTTLPFICLLFAGCQVAVPTPPPMPAAPAPEPRPVVVTTAEPIAPLQQKLRQQAQYIDALISQNEALSAKVNSAGAAPATNPGGSNNEVAPPTTPLTAPPISEPVTDLVTPNADGVIDLTAAAAGAGTGEAVNPFAVRVAPTGPAREVTLRVSGILAGKTPCAVVNDRLVQVNETIEALTVERIEVDSVILRYGGQHLRVPVSEQAVKVKLPL